MEDTRESIENIVRAVFPDASINYVDNTLDAWKAGRVDIFIIDLSAIAPIMLAHTAYAPICTLLEIYPGATVVINSAVIVDCALSVKEDILDQVSGANIHLAGHPFYETLPKVLTLIKQQQG
jgi:hypothetical protein